MTAHRRERQGAILRLIREREISTQSELVDALHETGYEAVQTTVSRDVTELGLVKVRAANGRLVYAPAGAADLDRLRELESAFRRWASDDRGERLPGRRLHPSRLLGRARRGDRRVQAPVTCSPRWRATTRSSSSRPRRQPRGTARRAEQTSSGRSSR